MSFPRYEQYKESGVELLGEIPQIWDVWKLAHAFARIGSGTTPKSDQPEYYDEGTIPWVNTGDLADGPLAACARKVTEKAANDYSSLKLHPSGSLLFAMYGATIGKLGILEFPATVNQACCVFSGDSPIAVKFLFYWFLGLRDKILSLATGGGQPNVSQDILRTLRVACPDLGEQKIIVSFLDTETSKIDALVAEQRRLIELLKEKRQAVISHAVTKGLDPNVKMKPSGIQWIKEIPEHWSTPPVFARYFAVLGKMVDDAKQTGEHPVRYLRNADVNWGTINIDNLPFIDIKPDELERFTLVSGDILICEGGAGVGQTAIWNGALDRCAFQKALHRLRPWNYENENPRFFFYCMRYVVETGIVLAGGTATIPHLTGEQLRKYRFPRPPKAEQDEIVHFLDEQFSKFAALESEADRAITLLQERRTALISAAVTGKIDVRHLPNIEDVI
jgi:type I restriction enzyme S subunit